MLSIVEKPHVIVCIISSRHFENFKLFRDLLYYNRILSTNLVKPTHFKYINIEDLNNTIYKFDLVSIEQNLCLIT